MVSCEIQRIGCDTAKNSVKKKETHRSDEIYWLFLVSFEIKKNGWKIRVYLANNYS